jgi:flagellar biosynthesis chaperone FliJ
MARGRAIGMEVLEDKIEKAQADVIKAKQNYDNATVTLKHLLNKRDVLRNEQLVAAITKSNRSYEEIMAFLNVGSFEEK